MLTKGEIIHGTLCPECGEVLRVDKSWQVVRGNCPKNGKNYEIRRKPVLYSTKVVSIGQHSVVLDVEIPGNSNDLKKKET